MVKINKLNNKTSKKNKGFTLVELILVICILAILIALIAPQLLGIRNSAHRTAFYAQVKQLHNAATMFIIDYPHTSVIWAPHAGTKAKDDFVLSSYNMHESWELYINEFPEDPTRPKGSTFVVEISTSGKITISPDTHGE